MTSFSSTAPYDGCGSRPHSTASIPVSFSSAGMFCRRCSDGPVFNDGSGGGADLARFILSAQTRTGLLSGAIPNDPAAAAVQANQPLALDTMSVLPRRAAS